MIPAISLNMTALTIAALYYYWRDVYVARRARERLLRQRVAAMLWAAAERAA